jgi:endopolyphosphatase
LDRHDEDHKIPRTTDEIYDLNRAVAKKMEKIFLNKGIPVIPSIGVSNSQLLSAEMYTNCEMIHRK